MISDRGFRPKRACEICKKRKVRCFLSDANASICRLCELYGRNCTFVQNNSAESKVVKGRIRQSKTSSIPGSSILSLGGVTNGKVNNVIAEGKIDRQDDFQESDIQPESKPDDELQAMPVAVDLSAEANVEPIPDSPLDIFQGWFMNNSNPFPVGPLEHVHDSPYDLNDDRETVTLPDYDCLTESQLHKTLGLQCNRYISYIGSTSQLDSLLLSFYEYNTNNTANFIEGSTRVRTIRKVQRLSEPTQENSTTKLLLGECEAFVLIEDPRQEDITGSGSPNSRSGWVAMSPRRTAEVKQVLEMTGNLGPKLMSLFVRHVLPCYPVMHKTTLLDKYNRSVYELSSSILGAIFYLSINWLAYDSEVSSDVLPPGDRMDEVTKEHYAKELPTPTISTVQAGLLFLQHDIYANEKPGQETPSWHILSQVVGAAYEVGLHLDSTNWDIPYWEKILRKRLGWAVYVQDKWTALISGRPSMINEENWTVPDIVAEREFTDLFVAEENEDEAYELSQITVNVTNSILLFCEMVKLSKILSDMLKNLFSSKHWAQTYDESNIDQKILNDLELVKGYHLQLREWYKSIPQRLTNSQLQDGELSPDGNLHIAFYAAELSLFRHLLKLLARSNSSDLVTLRQYVHQASCDLWMAAIDTVINLKSQHLQTFWYSFSKYNLSQFVTFGFLLFAVLEDINEKKMILKKMEIYRWSLVLFSKSASFMKHAVFWIDHYSTRLKSEISRVKQPN
ncbi:Dal81p [Sugiyamaella lignohabitans]|uniref:Dal81p n=1 Tax=Sugiyamaella lignohabitans TaxID=796027 RepID=A0A167F237_9ASCO|nr:Dal81p [Sugiyamaella lignohabitans]ANB14725.1 Dal81p [Sugiyamaella lignohabitans]